MNAYEIAEKYSELIYKAQSRAESILPLVLEAINQATKNQQAEIVELKHQLKEKKS